jgi:hypothetical protein
MSDTAAEEAHQLALAWRHGVTSAVPRLVREWAGLDEEWGALVMPPPLTALGVNTTPSRV